MRVLVTGGAGFIGSHLCERLIELGHEVICLDLQRTNLENLEGLHNFSHFTRDITCISSAGKDQIDVIFHLAALADIVPSINDPISYHSTNVLGTLKVLQYARGCKAKVIYAASSSCYGIPSVVPTSESEPCDPQYPYALTKYIGEQYVQHWSRVYNVRSVSLRLFNVYGPRHRTSGAYGAVFGTFLSQIANGAPATIVGDGTQTRDFTYVTDVVDAFVRAAESGASGSVYNVGSDGTYSINRLAELLGAKAVKYIPKRPGEPDVTFADISKINKDLGWYPKVSFEQGVAKMKELIPAYKDAPLWDEDSIKLATKEWFECLG